MGVLAVVTVAEFLVLAVAARMLRYPFERTGPQRAARMEKVASDPPEVRHVRRIGAGAVIVIVAVAVVVAEFAWVLGAWVAFRELVLRIW